MASQFPKLPIFPKSRIRYVLAFFILSFLLLSLHLFKLQVIQGSRESKNVYANTSQTVEEIPPRRGTIYDRSGRVLAQSVECYRVDIRPSQIKDSERKEVAGKLSAILQIPEGKILELLGKYNEPFPLDRQIDYEMAKRIRDLSLPGVDVLPSEKRVYPYGPLASHLLGFVHPDFGQSGREEFFGIEGIEGYFEKILHGTPGISVQFLSPTGEKLPVSPFQKVKVENGKDIVLTIDTNIQNITEDALERVAKEKKARSGCAIVFNVKTGEILAIASYPDFDPNNIDSAKKEDLFNVALQFAYEPGSAIKFMIGAAALEEGVVEPETIVEDEGPIIIDGNVFSCPSEFGGPHGKQNLYQLFKNSCNVGFIKLGQKLGIEKVYRYLRLFGLGTPSDFELPASLGRVNPPEEWSNSDLAAVSFGYGVEVTPLQLASAFQIVANEGKFVPLHVVKEIKQNGATIESVEFRSTRQVISKRTALQLKEALKGPIEGKVPQGLDQYGVFGKTGTARAWKEGNYSDLNNTTFVGAFPFENPQIGILININEPQVEFAYAVRVCVPVFMEIAAKIVDIMRFPLP
ncbi:MAG: penicillin-binding protein 2 [Caldiserica bacterium]|nr:penicillin-binding protein 2 [Caldisericota bacterium]MDH7562996.1 penicillin-binding protein 2 [Caldisericota bacterium]